MSVYQWFIPCKACGKRRGDAHSPWLTDFVKPCCYCWVWSTRRCPARTQCLSWWAGSGHPRRSASGRQRTWSTPDGKPCPAHASSSQTPESSSHRKHRDRPDRRAWGSLSDIIFFPACSRAGGPPPRVDSHTGHSWGSLHASTARWPSGRICHRCSADTHRRSAETVASGGPHPPVPRWLPVSSSLS